LKRFFIASLCSFFALAGCGQATTKIFPANAAARAGARFGPLSSSKVDHVVIIIQENRTVDNLFNGLPGADTVRQGKNSDGGYTELQPVALAALLGISHKHSAFEIEYDHGRLDGFDKVFTKCHPRHDCPRQSQRAYSYVPREDIKPYFEMAEEYGFADRMFQSNQGPSFPAHQYLLSGTSEIATKSPLRAAENPLAPNGHFTGGCDSPPGSLVLVINEKGQQKKQVYPCFNHIALPDLLEKKSLSWRYYGTHPHAGLWNAPDAIEQIRDSPEFATDDVTPPTRVLTDISQGSLASVSWVTPTSASSDHPGSSKGLGPSWVASIVNAVGESQYWKNTVILVVWDDWGGWYDHVRPPIYNSYELGFRVPLIVISPYVKKGYVSDRVNEFGSILKFIETNFDLGSLGATDDRAGDLSEFFNYDQAPRKFVRIKAPFQSGDFLKEPPSALDPDPDDNL
jgi:phospholipase C